MVNLSNIGTEEEISAAVERLASAPTVDTAEKHVHYTFHIVGGKVSILAHEINAEAPIVGIIRMTTGQWRQISEALGPAAEAHAIIPHDGETHG